MSTAILKSPVYFDPRSRVAAPAGGLAESGVPGGDVSSSLALCPDPVAEAEAEARVRAELTHSLKAQYEAEFESRWMAERDKAHAEGYQAGLIEGHEEGRTSAQDAFRKKQSLVEKVLAQIEEEAEQWRQSVQEQAHAVARLALCELLGEQALSPAFLEGLIRRVTQGLRDQDILTVRLHPSDARALREACTARSDTAAIAGVVALAERVIDDAHLSAGGVVVDTPRGEYQATLDTLLTKLLKLVDQQRAQRLSQDQVPHDRLA